jgi:hypothetical protein
MSKTSALETNNHAVSPELISIEAESGTLAPS